MRRDYRFDRINYAKLGTQANRQPIPTDQALIRHTHVRDNKHHLQASHMR